MTIYNPFIAISAVPGDTVCAGFPVTIQATLAGGGATPSFQWILNSTAIAGTTSSNYTYIPSNGDSISCILTSSSPCVGNPVVSSNTIHLVLNPTTTPTITITSTATAIIGSVVTVNATVTSAGGSYNINWYRNGTLFSTTSIPIVTYVKVAGTDDITATVISTSPGCFDSTTSPIFTVSDSHVAVINLITSQVHIYPNPVYDVLHLDNVDKQTGYSLLTIVGSVIKQNTLVSGHNVISLQSLPPGVYMLEILNRDGEKIITKIIKQ